MKSFILPEGTPRVKLDSLVHTLAARGQTVQTGSLKDTGAYPAISQSTKYSEGRVDTDAPIRASEANPVLLFGSHNCNVKLIVEDFVVAGGGAELFSVVQGVNPRYAFYTIRHFAPVAEGYKSHSADLRRKIFPLPPLEVQNKIVEILDAHSELAELQAERVRLLKLEKDVLLGSLFSREAKFNLSDSELDTAKWPVVSLLSVATLRNSKRTILNSVQRSVLQGPYPYYGSTTVQDFLSIYNLEGEYVLLSEDAGPFFDFEERAIAQYFSGKGSVNNHAHLLEPLESDDAFFLYCSLVHKDLRAFVNGRDRPKLNSKALASIQLKWPDKATRNLVSKYFREFDNLIKLEEERLQLLKTQSAVVLEAIFKN